MTPRETFTALKDELKLNFLERDDVIEGLLSAILCRQHVLILGGAGTAKSAIVSAFSSAIQGGSYFYWLLTKFTTPEELFGPISLAKLQKDQVCRITQGKLPQAHLVFLDEVYKANSAILNALLTVINERVYHNDGTAQPCPLMTVVGASNELPESSELEALHDRFLVRYWVPYLNDVSNVRKMISSPDPKVNLRMSLQDIEVCQNEAMAVKVLDTTYDAILLVKQRTEEQGFKASDRRWKHIVKLLKAHAYLNGDDVVLEDHLDIISDCLWREPKDRPQLAAVVGTVGNPLNVRATEILDAAKETAAKLGSVTPSEGSQKAEWLKQASLIETSLTQMESELKDIVTNNPKRNLKKVMSASDHIQKLRKNITKRVAELYNL